MSNNLKKYWWVILILILLLLIIFSLIFVIDKSETTKQSNGSEVSTGKESTSSAQAVTKPTKELDEYSLKEVVSKKTGIPVNNFYYDISDNNGKYAKGSVSASDGSTGGEYWLAVKVKGEWNVVYAGQDTPKCSQVNPHDFPISLVPECSSAGNLVIR